VAAELGARAGDLLGGRVEVHANALGEPGAGLDSPEGAQSLDEVDRVAAVLAAVAVPEVLAALGGEAGRVLAAVDRADSPTSRAQAFEAQELECAIHASHAEDHVGELAALGR